jgi:predicted ATPase/class 3 adenylate cyclase
VDLPAGTVTFLFTDIEGSTRLLHELGDGYAEALAEHRRALRAAFGEHSGVEVDTQGDAFFVAFSRAGDALAAARDGQAALANGPIRVRMGLHTGEPVVTDEGYVGLDVHRAARIAAVGHGGQVLVSASTVALAEASNTVLLDLGEHRLKDLTAPERIYQLGDGEFPPLKSLYRTNLPIVATPLVGRERELGDAVSLLQAHRLLTLTGAGGSGKTRLAIHLAAAAADDFPDGVFWVPLQAVRDPAIVEHTIAAAVGAEDGLVHHVAGKRMLILLDNFEQIVEAAPTVSALLSATPNAKVLVTSREPLHVAGEQCFAVEPLQPAEAEVLFEERARAVVQDFRPTAEVAAICERLDRLPLAVELAAARVALLDPSELLARLDQRLAVLTSRSRDAPARQQTLRATIDWSYELLDPDEQRVFRGLSVFRGSFSLDAATEVCETDLETVESLVLKNLVRPRFGSGRLLLLDTIREFAGEQLEGSAEADHVHRRHFDYFLALARSTNLNSGDLAPGGQRLDVAFVEQDNLRGALTWAIRGGETELALELAVALDQFWVANDAAEGVRWFRRAFQDPAEKTVPAPIRAHAFRALGASLHIAGDLEAAGLALEQSLALFEEIGDEHGRAVLLHRLSITAIAVHGDLVRARELVEASHELHARGDNWWTMTWGHAQTVGTLGAIARESGDAERALELVAESAELARAAGVEWWQGGMLGELAALSLRQERIDEAERHARESLEIAARLGDRSGRVFGVGLLATVAAARGEQERAGRLWGAIEEETAHAPLGGWERHREECEARIRQLSGPEFERGLAAGRELELDQGVSEALVRLPA